MHCLCLFKQTYKSFVVDQLNGLGRLSLLNPIFYSLSRLNFNRLGQLNEGDIDVGDGCWRQNVLVISFRC